MEKIISLSNELIKHIYSLSQKKNRIEYKEYMLEGYHLVNEAYKLGLLKIVLSTNPKDLIYKDVRQIVVSEAIISKLSTTKTPQKIIGVCKIDEKEIDWNDKYYVVLDNVSDPGNMGTIIRTSIALGVKNIYISSDSVDYTNEKVIRATQGTIFKANIKILDLNDIYAALKQHNINVVVTSLNTSTNIKDVKRLDSFALVVGNEANGISETSKLNAFKNITIPMKNNTESLNVSIAFGIALFELLNK